MRQRATSAGLFENKQDLNYKFLQRKKERELPSNETSNKYRTSILNNILGFYKFYNKTTLYLRNKFYNKTSVGGVWPCMHSGS